MAFGMGFGEIEMDLTETGVTLRNLYGWPGWVIEVDIAWSTWSARTVRDIPPPRTRSNARRPTDDPELVRRIRKAAEAAKELPRSSIWVVSLALPTPHKKKTDGVQLRAATIGTMYNYALNLGLSRSALSRRSMTSLWWKPRMSVRSPPANTSAGSSRPVRPSTQKPAGRTSSPTSASFTLPGCGRSAADTHWSRAARSQRFPSPSEKDGTPAAS
ncbi:hypothetical protein ACFYPN_19855 [Streptomyces sp. NPDC005576]|uniref:hypothetical protein n=1 Tax=unclassified Streptomyces TaxID=2593676 RepID=UPI0033C9A905